MKRPLRLLNLPFYALLKKTALFSGKFGILLGDEDKFPKDNEKRNKAGKAASLF